MYRGLWARGRRICVLQGPGRLGGQLGGGMVYSGDHSVPLLGFLLYPEGGDNFSLFGGGQGDLVGPRVISNGGRGSTGSGVGSGREQALVAS